MPRNLTFSDHHFNHFKIIELCHRPFTDLLEMNSSMIRFWEESVEPNDIVFYVGDFGFGKQEHLKLLLSRLPGFKILIRGNHDPKPRICTEMGWEQVHETLKFTTRYGRSVLLSHRPIEHPPMGVEVVVHGHIHDRVDKLAFMNINVSVEAINYRAVDLDELVENHFRVMGW